MVVQVLADRERRLLGVPLGPVAIGAVVDVGGKDRFEDQLHGRLHHTICSRRAAQRSDPALRLGHLDPPDRRQLVVGRTQGGLHLLDIASPWPVVTISSMACPSTPGAPWLALTWRQASHRTSSGQTFSYTR